MGCCFVLFFYPDIQLQKPTVHNKRVLCPSNYILFFCLKNFSFFITLILAFLLFIT